MSNNPSKEALLIDAAWAVLLPIAGQYGIADSREFARRLARPPAGGPEIALTIKEAAARLGVCSRTIRDWQKSGILPAIRINTKSVKVPESAVIALQQRGVRS